MKYLTLKSNLDFTTKKSIDFKDGKMKYLGLKSDEESKQDSFRNKMKYQNLKKLYGGTKNQISFMCWNKMSDYMLSSKKEYRNLHGLYNKEKEIEKVKANRDDLNKRYLQEKNTDIILLQEVESDINIDGYESTCRGDIVLKGDKCKSFKKLDTNKQSSDTNSPHYVRIKDSVQILYKPVRFECISGYSRCLGKGNNMNIDGTSHYYHYDGSGSACCLALLTDIEENKNILVINIHVQITSWSPSHSIAYIVQELIDFITDSGITEGNEIDGYVLGGDFNGEKQIFNIMDNNQKMDWQFKLFSDKGRYGWDDFNATLKTYFDDNLGGLNEVELDNYTAVVCGARSVAPVGIIPDHIFYSNSLNLRNHEIDQSGIHFLNTNCNRDTLKAMTEFHNAYNSDPPNKDLTTHKNKQIQLINENNQSVVDTAADGNTKPISDHYPIIVHFEWK